MEDNKFEIIYADFPWKYSSFGTAKLPYETMEDEEIFNFDFSKFMAKDCILFSWATGPKMQLAFRAAEHWEKNHGLYYQGIPYIWVKTKQDGTPIGAAGPRPRLVKPLDEFLLAFSTTPNKRTFPLLSESHVQHQFFPKQSKHSRKPQEFRDLIVDLLGNRKRIELFAREQAEGWSGWGNQYEGS